MVYNTDSDMNARLFGSGNLHSFMREGSLVYWICG